MALAWTTIWSMPRLQEYCHAEAHERDVKPIRGDANNTKPLGKRSQKWRSIKREDNGDICIYEGWAEPTIRYRPNGDVLVYDRSSWNKASSHDLASRLLGMQFETFDGKSWVNLHDGRFELRPSPRVRWDSMLGKWVPSSGVEPENIFRFDARMQRWTYVNPPEKMRLFVNRAGAKRVRQRYAAFATYMSAMVKLRGGSPPSLKEYVEPFGAECDPQNPHLHWHHENMPAHMFNHNFKHEDAAQLCNLMLSTDVADQYKAQLWLLRRYSAWDNSMPDWHKNMERAMAMHHHDEWFTKRPVTAGKKYKDTYAWAMPE